MSTASVIIPTYNNAKTIARAILSVLEQEGQDFEIIVVDDGSTDNTRETMAKFIKGSSKVKYFYQQNRGPAAARNAGIKKAQGDYIVFLDSDDVLLSGSLKKRLAFMDNYRRIDFLFTDYIFVCDKPDLHNGRLKKTGFLSRFEDAIEMKKGTEVIFNNNFFYKFLYSSPQPIWMGTVTLRNRQIVDKLFREDYFIVDDNECWMRLIRNKSVGYIDQPTAVYQHNHSNISKQAEKYCLNSIKLFTEIYSKEKESVIRRHAKERLGSSHFSLGYHYYKQQKYHKAVSHLLKSFYHNPSVLVAGVCKK